MNIQQLRYLVATADIGTMTGAAQSLHVTQPALTRALRALESEVGVALFVRNGRRVELTDEGREIVAIARRIVRDVDSLTARREHTTRVCGTPTQARELCAGAIARLRESAPTVTVSIVTADSAAEVAEQVDAGLAELGVCDVPVDADLQCSVLGVQELALAHPPEWVLPDPLSFADLDGMQIIAPPPGDRRRVELDTAFATHGVTLNVIVATDQRDLVLPLVLDGVGASFAWPATARDARQRGAGVVSLEPPVQREVGVLRRRGRLTTGARHVLAALEAEAELVLRPVGPRRKEVRRA